jgi:flagellar protein FlbD
MVNADLLESVEPTPDTVITLVSGNKLIVRDSMDDIQHRIIEFKRKIYGPPENASTAAGSPAQGDNGSADIQ